jgi:hypothetical protein
MRKEVRVIGSSSEYEDLSICGGERASQSPSHDDYEISAMRDSYVDEPYGLRPAKDLRSLVPQP